MTQKWNGFPISPHGRAAKSVVLVAALTVAERDGFGRMSRASVAAQAGCSNAMVSYYFSTMTQLRRDVMRAAVRDGKLRIIAEGLVCGHEHARRAPAALKQKALATLG